MGMDDEAIIKVVAIAALAAIVIAALFKGIDSALVGTVAAIIGGVAGYTIGRTTG
jgi:L-cysteine desulfidase